MVAVLIVGLAAALLIRQFPGMLPFLFAHGLALAELAAGIAVVWWVAADVLPHMR